MSNGNGSVTAGERIIRIDERTKTMAKDIEEIKDSLNGKVDKEDCVAHRIDDRKETETVKRIALSKRSKSECDGKHKVVDERADDQKGDWQFWVTSVALIVFGVFDVIMGIKVFYGA